MGGNDSSAWKTANLLKPPALGHRQPQAAEPQVPALLSNPCLLWGPGKGLKGCLQGGIAWDPRDQLQGCG